jgi:hypothetical protein
MTNLIPIGTRVRFTKTIIEDATGDHPRFLLAEEGELGNVAVHYEFAHLYPYGVVADRCPNRFAVAGDEIEEVTA